VPLSWRPLRSWGVGGGSGGLRGSLPERGTHPSLILVMGLVGLTLAGLGGCGASEGVSSGATVHVYSSAPLSGPEAVSGRTFCADARKTLARAGGKVGDVHFRLTCLDDARGARWRLAAIGANARRATEDSATVAYLGEPQAGAARFSATILEAAGIGQVAGRSGAAAMSKVLKAVDEAGGAEDLRANVRKDLEGGQ